MDRKTLGQLTHIHFKILVAINVMTLMAVVAVLLNQPPTYPRHEQLTEMVEAQDWLIGSMSKHLQEQTVELAKLKFGMGKSESSMELESARQEYEAERMELGLDLDKSREKLEARYEEMIEEYEIKSNREQGTSED